MVSYNYNSSLRFHPSLLWLYFQTTVFSTRWIRRLHSNPFLDLEARSPIQLLSTYSMYLNLFKITYSSHISRQKVRCRYNTDCLVSLLQFKDMFHSKIQLASFLFNYIYFTLADGITYITIRGKVIYVKVSLEVHLKYCHAHVLLKLWWYSLVP